MTARRVHVQLGGWRARCLEAEEVEERILDVHRIVLRLRRARTVRRVDASEPCTSRRAWLRLCRRAGAGGEGPATWTTNVVGVAEVSCIVSVRFASALHEVSCFDVSPTTHH
eukprot:6202743-Prymnesium_polylepis.1